MPKYYRTETRGKVTHIIKQHDDGKETSWCCVFAVTPLHKTKTDPGNDIMCKWCVKHAYAALQPPKKVVCKYRACGKLFTRPKTASTQNTCCKEHQRLYKAEIRERYEPKRIGPPAWSSDANKAHRKKAYRKFYLAHGCKLCKGVGLCLEIFVMTGKFECNKLKTRRSAQEISCGV